jgi:hypothetical protein
MLTAAHSVFPRLMLWAHGNITEVRLIVSAEQVRHVSPAVTPPCPPVGPRGHRHVSCPPGPLNLTGLT